MVNFCVIVGCGNRKICLHMFMIKLSDGLAASVWQTDLNFDAVTLPAQSLNQSLLLDWSLVFASTALHCSMVAVKPVLLESSSKS